MRSKARIGTHPLHPILIAFPIAFLSASVLSDLAAWVAQPALYTVASYLMIAGVVTGLIAAVPGSIDLFAAVPPDSSARNRGLVHMVVNVSSVVLFAVSWYYRNPDLSFNAFSFVLELLAGVLIGVGGWIGGTLVYRDQIGIDHRYAREGQWRELEVHLGGKDWIAVGNDGELEPGQMKLLTSGSAAWSLRGSSLTTQSLTITALIRAVRSLMGRSYTVRNK